MGILDLIYPKICLGCGRWGKYVCDRCQVGLIDEEQLCPGCGLVSRYGLRHKQCGNKGELVGLTCFWAYEGLVKKLIEEAKYEGYYNCLNEIVELSLDSSDREEFEYFRNFLKLKPILVPVPLYKIRERKRGFNQSELVAKSFASRYLLSLDSHLLVRIRDTGQQVGRTRDERLKAVKGAFGTNSKYQTPNSKFEISKNVLLVDDVWTTGATMQECALVLKKCGVKNVWGLVLAR